jgi:prolyl-tRNA synthetase
MMQDGKALQAGTSHYLGTGFAEAQNIRYQTDKGDWAFAHTTSWGVSTRLIGGVIMTHGDDDGLRLPPAIAPRQVVVVPMLRDKPEDAEILAYGEALVKALNAQTALGQPLRALLDRKPVRSAEKRWAWVRKGAPIIVEIGPRDAAAGRVTYMRRDDLRDGEKVRMLGAALDEFVASAPALLAEIQAGLYAEAKVRLDTNIKDGIETFEALAEHFGPAAVDEADQVFRGWARVAWSRPEGEALEAVDLRLKALKLTARNTPLGGTVPVGTCVFTGDAAVETILLGRTY